MNKHLFLFFFPGHRRDICQEPCVLEAQRVIKYFFQPPLSPSNSFCEKGWPNSDENLINNLKPVESLRISIIKNNSHGHLPKSKLFQCDLITVNSNEKNTAVLCFPEATGTFSSHVSASFQ